ncbi:MAG: hypothetical protein A2X12_08440 [Bacteroidetes bacterium GWE2_29_8]|nr:MAG: hypothetical protein A2X12_08440 [Bacteroidetes bacterium GWE2_29_8]OFY15893.1 MAG: hypothetical protein A2X02_04835 [Bacteroidetes bacterium GWF2_29_10]
MKKIGYILFFLVLILSSCSNKEKKVIKTFPDGSPELEKTYVIKDGKEILIKETKYYEKDHKYIDREMKDSIPDGLSTVWYKNGNKWSEGYFKNGLANGKRTVWYENGKKRYDGNYKYDKPSGVWNFYDETGKKVKEIDYDKLESNN